MFAERSRRRGPDGAAHELSRRNGAGAEGAVALRQAADDPSGEQRPGHAETGSGDKTGERHPTQGRPGDGHRQSKVAHEDDTRAAEDQNRVPPLRSSGHHESRGGPPHGHGAHDIAGQQRRHPIDGLKNGGLIDVQADGADLQRKDHRVTRAADGPRSRCVPRQQPLARRLVHRQGQRKRSAFRRPEGSTTPATPRVMLAAAMRPTDKVRVASVRHAIEGGFSSEGGRPPKQKTAGDRRRRRPAPRTSRMRRARIPHPRRPRRRAVRQCWRCPTLRRRRRTAGPTSAPGMSPRWRRSRTPRSIRRRRPEARDPAEIRPCRPLTRWRRIPPCRPAPRATVALRSPRRCET